MVTRAWRVAASLGLLGALSGPPEAQGESDEGSLSVGFGAEEGFELAWVGPAQDGAELLRAIAAARVDMDVGGDLEEVARRLTELSLRAMAAQAFEGQTEALVQAVLARAELAVRRGDPAQAAQELRQVLPVRIQASEIALGEATPSLRSALKAARSDARVVQALARVEEHAGGARTSDSDSLERLVDELFEEREYGEIVSIGFAAFERFAERVRATAPDLPTSSSTDPLLPLMQLDERRAARFLAQHLASGGPYWRRRILLAMRARDVLENDGTWTSSRPFVCLEPEWLELLERFLAERETAAEAVPFFASVERRDALTESLSAAFVQALRTLGPDFATLALQAFDHDGVVASAQPALEAALALSDARLRRFAAQKLVNFRRSEALLARVRDEETEVRRCVAQALGPHKLWTWYFDDGRAYGQDTPGRVDERDSGTLQALLADPDAGIRASAVELLDVLETPLDEAVYARLCNDPAPSVRAALVGVDRLAPATRGRMLALLARDPAQQVIRSLDNVLDNDFGSYPGEISTTPGPFLEALEARWKDAERPLKADLRDRVMRSLLESAEGTRALVAWMLSEPKPEELKFLEGWAKPEALLALPDELLARLVASTDAPWIWNPLRGEGPKRVERPAAMRLLLADETAPRSVRLSAARLAAGESPLFRPAFLQLLRDPSWKTKPPDDDERPMLRRCAGEFEAVPRNALAVDVLRDAAITSEVADAFVAAFQPEAAHGRELAEAVLARWLRPGAPWSAAVDATLRQLGQLPELVRLELLEQALPTYPYAVVEALGELADPKFLPLLARAMRAEWLPSSDRENLQRSVATALGAFEDDEAVAILLAGLRSNDANVRGLCQQSLERIKAYRGQVEIWRGQARAAPTKASALGELVAMLTHADPLVRKEAARGLGALGATEALPDLIRALKDADAGVRSAAQASLERLNAAPSGD